MKKIAGSTAVDLRLRGMRKDNGHLAGYQSGKETSRTASFLLCRGKHMGNPMRRSNFATLMD